VTINLDGAGEDWQMGEQRHGFGKESRSGTERPIRKPNAKKGTKGGEMAERKGRKKLPKELGASSK
jgi:hypothetical protein